MPLVHPGCPGNWCAFVRQQLKRCPCTVDRVFYVVRLCSVEFVQLCALTYSMTCVCVSTCNANVIFAISSRPVFANTGSHGAVLHMRFQSRQWQRPCSFINEFLVSWFTNKVSRRYSIVSIVDSQTRLDRPLLKCGSYNG